MPTNAVCPHFTPGNVFGEANVEMPISVEWQHNNDCVRSYLIVGAGVFGASTALHLKRSKPQARVTLIDRLLPNPAAASSDLSKIIRADYADIFYMELALEAQLAWQNDPLYQRHFHRTGMVFAENLGKGPAFLRNYASLGASTEGRLMSVDEARTKFPTLANGNWQGVKMAYYNPASGWGDAEPALKAVVDAAIAEGVQFHTGTVEKLLLRRSRPNLGKPAQTALQCIGVRLHGGVEIQANHILLSTGASTARLLADSAPTEPSFQAAGRLVAAAALSCTVRVDPADWHLYREAPVFANLMSHTCGMY
jgi:sarcosine oxidase/L-pipecolate oxidase